MRRSFATLCLALTYLDPALAAPAIEHLEPPFWWTGMQHKNVQLLVHGAGIGRMQPALAYPGVRIVSSTRVANPNYLFIDLEIAPGAQPGSLDLVFEGADGTLRQPYQLRAREPGSRARQGFGNADAIYQIMPDRFANGDPANDSVPGMLERADRKHPGGRHGGDIQGAIDRLDYIAGLGFTQLWPTPLVENDMPAWSYHGYAATNHYRIDPRYGSNDDFVRLSQEARKRGIGLIQDVVLSHIGKNHWWMKDLPTPDWINFGGQFVPTAHHRVAVQDRYASQADSRNFTAGWFVESMPDLNQTNPLVANYLIQNNIWWIEYAGLSGLRIDTYSYSDGAFLTQYTKRLMDEYPHLNLVGEEWSTLVPVVARWQRGKVNFDGYISSLPSLMDFPLVEAMRTALTDPTKGFNEVYQTLALDHLYPAPDKLVLFGGNHDMARMYSAAGEDFDRYRMNLVFLMTMPRIPQFYTGDEILMTSTVKGRDDASYRRDFPGGWTGDRVDAFSGKGLTRHQHAAQELVRKLANWRKGQAVIHNGKLMHFGPEENTWVYFRYSDNKRVMVAMNNNDKEMRLPIARFQEMLKGTGAGIDVLTGQTVDLTRELRLAPKATLLIELPET
ncbi:MULTISPECIES: glycoside hydrolase family 13 protein [unclassified Massilia]|uniref:glycoside hydrolase family 13 protein n=1 Tax=unclassified Massilia TaxID=2609279 RepID=UPI00177B4793|nr:MULTISPECIES: glycoside hydrolase family 13 protein [unclassified Massilia]MBD8529801.1 glycoside hydrolase family 13 protein [Massilia sp. CFBP 13647]MBD8672187.1 glycoside hydrolase family 13 protein [Massilia sp. CFBP 13721]